MLIILDKNPEVAASLVPDKIKFKQLIELCQLVCSTGICGIFKAVEASYRWLIIGVSSLVETQLVERN